MKTLLSDVREVDNELQDSRPAKTQEYINRSKSKHTTLGGEDGPFKDRRFLLGRLKLKDYLGLSSFNEI